MFERDGLIRHRASLISAGGGDKICHPLVVDGKIVPSVPFSTAREDPAEIPFRQLHCPSAMVNRLPGKGFRVGVFSVAEHREKESMKGSAGIEIAQGEEVGECAMKPLPPSSTLLELVQTVMAETENDTEVVATVIYLINSGKVRLCGTFAGAKITFAPQAALSEGVR